ncbi:receptor expression-enhancing protein 5 [Trichonephila clavipes]|nr:receptor expression-enhancing protein 5 [Trichonephila clavipes]
MLSINQGLLILDKKLQEDNKFNEMLKKVEDFSGIERRKLVLATVFILGAMVIIGYGAQLICNGVGFAYPAYASILAIESRNKDDDTCWLTYWVVFAALSLAEFFSDFILALIPFYWMLKCLFLIWCFLPFSMNGSKFIYHRFIRPVFLSHLAQAESQDNSPGEEHEKSS